MVPSNRYSGGFTLLEALVAFALLGLGVTLTMQVFHRSVDQTAALAREHRALRMLENAIESVRATPFDELVVGKPLPLPAIAFDEESDIYVIDGGIHVYPHADSDRLVSVTVRVNWAESGRMIRRDLTTLVADDS